MLKFLDTLDNGIQKLTYRISLRMNHVIRYAMFVESYP